MADSVIERLMQTNPDLEVWWDSSPLVFASWMKSMIDRAPAARKEERAAQLGRLFNAADPAKSVFRGCTTNPPLSLAAVKSDPQRWDARVRELAHENPGVDAKGLFWMVYKDVIRKGAGMFYPLYEASNRRFGWISGQLDPRLFTEKEIMYQQADDIASIAPNVMVKVPATQQGVDVVRYLTSKAISTNVTTCFTMPQIMAVARAAKEGYEIGRKNGVDMSGWRAVITHMLGRLIERKELDAQAEYCGVKLSEADKKWFGAAVFKRACRMIREGGYPSKMLLCSVRPGPLVSGKMRYWDIESFAGGDIVFTLPPGALTPLFDIGDDLEFRAHAIDEEVPSSAMEKILKTPYGKQAYDPYGLSLDQFNTHPSTLFTVDEFGRAAAGLEEYVAKIVATL
jgi:transaldolase